MCMRLFVIENKYKGDGCMRSACPQALSGFDTLSLI
jgi:hypothetical protein